MNFFLRAFEYSEKKMSRERELQADYVCSLVGSKEAMAVALVKFYRYQSVFVALNAHLRERLTANEMPAALAPWFQESCQQLTSLERTELVIHEQGISHSTDTHPPLTDRLDSMGIALSDTYVLACTIPSEPASTLISNALEIEEELTNIECFRVLHEWGQEVQP